MYKAFKYRLYPNESQKELIANHIGSCRFVYSLALETKNSANSGPKHSYTTFNLINHLPSLKEDFAWLRDVNSPGQQGAGFPKFKRKSERGSFNAPQPLKVSNHDRDINAAINIKSFALKIHLSGEHTLKNQDELPTLVGVPTPEAYPIDQAVGG